MTWDGFDLYILIIFKIVSKVKFRLFSIVYEQNT